MVTLRLSRGSRKKTLEREKRGKRKRKEKKKACYD
jgi:hypothetical protein